MSILPFLFAGFTISSTPSPLAPPPATKVIAPAPAVTGDSAADWEEEDVTDPATAWALVKRLSTYQLRIVSVRGIAMAPGGSDSASVAVTVSNTGSDTAPATRVVLTDSHDQRRKPKYIVIPAVPAGERVTVVAHVAQPAKEDEKTCYEATLENSAGTR